MRSSLSFRLVPLALLLAVTACSSAVRAPAAGTGAATPADAVERFLRLAAEPDYMQMAWIFGTDKGPIIRRDPASDVERRMYAIARVLENEQFAVRSQRPVPGRVGNAIQVDVALTQRGREHLVPFTVVRGPGERWYIEQVQLEAITGRQ